MHMLVSLNFTRNLYYCLSNSRVKMASQEVEKRNKPCWENCLPSMTPQWLTSLLVDAPKTLEFSEELKQKIRNDPQKYLRLLKVCKCVLYNSLNFSVTI